VTVLLEKFEEGSADVVRRGHDGEIFVLLHCGKRRAEKAVR
jgi:hypothetical protein